VLFSGEMGIGAWIFFPLFLRGGRGGGLAALSSFSLIFPLLKRRAAGMLLFFFFSSGTKGGGLWRGIRPPFSFLSRAKKSEEGEESFFSSFSSLLLLLGTRRSGPLFSFFFFFGDFTRERFFPSDHVVRIIYVSSAIEASRTKAVSHCLLFSLLSDHRRPPLPSSGCRTATLSLATFSKSFGFFFSVGRSTGI